MSPVDRVVAALREAGVDAEVRSLDRPVPTAAAAAEALGCEVGAIANSLVFDADGAPLLVLASGAHRVDTRKVAALVGAERVRRATPEFVLAAHRLLWAGGGDHHTMVSLTYADLLRLTGGDEAAVA